MNYCWAGPKRPGGPQRMRKRSPATTQPRLAPASAAATDKGDPSVSERNRGREEDDDATRRRWHLRRDHRRYCVRLTPAHLEDPFIAMIAAARGSGDGHGSARPRLGRLRREDDATSRT